MNLMTVSCAGRGIASNESEEAVAPHISVHIIRDLMVGKRPAALVTTFFTKRGRKVNLYFVDILYIYVLLTKCTLFS